MNEFAGALTRATGLVAMALVAAALLLGPAIAAGETGRRRRPAWWLDLHGWLGGAALALTVAHVAIALTVANGPSIVGALVPFAANADRVALGTGAVATYLLAVTVLTTWPRRIRQPRLWRLIHLGSVAAAVLTATHALQLGTDAATIAFQASLFLVLIPLTFALGVRLFGALANRWTSGAARS